MTARRRPREGRGSSRERLIAATRDLIYLRGIRACNVDDLAAAAEVSKPTLYAHFATKEDLVHAALEDRRLDRQRQIGAALDRLDDPMKRLSAMLEIHAGYVPGADFRGCPLVAASLEMHESAPARQSAERFKTWIQDRIAKEARAAGLDDPRGLAASLLLLIEGTIVMGYVRGGRGPGRDLRRAWKALLASHRPSAS